MEGTRYRKSLPIADVVATICSDNKDVSTMVIGLIADGLRSQSSEQLRPYFRVLMRLQDLADSLLQPERIASILTTLLQCMEESSMYWKITDFLIDHVIRMAKKNAITRQWLAANGARIDWMSAWIAQNPKPPGDNKTKTMMLERERARAGQDSLLYHQQAQTYTQTSPHMPYGLEHKAKLIALDIIKNGTFNDLGADNASDSDKELQDRKIQANDDIDCLDTDLKWLKAKVREVQGNKVFVHYCGFHKKWDEWIAMTSPRIAKFGRFSPLEPANEPAQA
jgi:hypothetical protein